MRLQIGRIYHDHRRICVFGGQADHDPGEDTVIASTLPAIVEGLVRSIFPRRLTPSQAIAVDKNNAAQNLQIIHAWAAAALGKERRRRAICASVSQNRAFIDQVPLWRPESGKRA